MKDLLYSPAVMINKQKEFFLDDKKYDTEEVPSTILTAMIKELIDDLLSVDITCKIDVHNKITTLTPSRETEVMINGEKIMLKEAEFYNHTFEIIDYDNA